MNTTSPFPKRKIFFNEEKHKYTDDLNRVYTSMTTVIGKYEAEKDARKMAEGVYKKYYNMVGHRYYKKSIPEILDMWKRITTKSQNRGNNRHNFLEQTIKTANGYNRTVGGLFINDYIYTIDDIIDNHSFGEINLEFFVKTGIKDKYPEIYETIAYFVQLGYSIYAEIGVYNPDLIVSGLIDVLMVNHTKGTFIILDWKTNKEPLHFHAGYYLKDNQGRFTGEWRATPDARMKAPLAHIEDCHGSTYTLQLSGYAYLVEQFGYTCEDLILCHIRPEKLDEYHQLIDGVNDIVEFHRIPYWKYDVERMFKHHYRVYGDKQTRLNI